MTAVKFFHDDMPGAPVLSGQAGALSTLLDTCLVNGFGAGALDSIVIAGGIATATRSLGHPFEPDAIAEIGSATVSGGSINGPKRVLTTTTNTFTFDATGISNQTATGSPTAKVAGAGWTKPFSGTNLAIFRSADSAGAQHYLRVDDTGDQNARVVAYETMSDANTGTGPYPTAAQISGGGYWPKSNAASSAARGWALWADSRSFMLAVCWAVPGASDAYSVIAAFGDPLPFKTPDTYSSFVNVAGSSQVSTLPGSTEYDMDTAGASTSTGLYCARSYTGLGASAAMMRANPLGFTSGITGSRSGGSSQWQYPNGPDGGLYVGPVIAAETVSKALRGTLPGLYYSPQGISQNVFANRERVTGITNLAGRTLMAMNSGTGAFFVDITGPWR